MHGCGDFAYEPSYAFRSATTTAGNILIAGNPQSQQARLNGQPLTYGGTLTVTNLVASPPAPHDSFTLFSSTCGNNFTTTNLRALPPKPRVCV